MPHTHALPTHAARQRPPAPQRRAYLPVATMLLVLACTAIFAYDISNTQAFVLGTGPSQIGDQVVDDLGRYTLYSPSLEINGEWYRVITSGFVHFSWSHLGMNMVLLIMTGRLIEGAFGALTFISVYATGLVAGSLGAILIDGHTQVGGASGAIFALLGAMAVLQHMSGENVFRSGLAPLLVVNILLSFSASVSLGGHAGGLVAGALAGAAIGYARRRRHNALAMVPVTIAALGFVLFLAIIPAAQFTTANLGA